MLRVFKDRLSSPSKMTTISPPTIRVQKLRERRSKGVAMVAPVEVGEGGFDLLVSHGLLGRAQANDRHIWEFQRYLARKYCLFT